MRWAGGIIVALMCVGPSCGRSANGDPPHAAATGGRGGSSGAGDGARGGSSGSGNGGRGGTLAGSSGSSAGSSTENLECSCDAQPRLCERTASVLCSEPGVMTPPTLDDALRYARSKPGVVCGSYSQCEDGSHRFGWAISFEGACELVFDRDGKLVHESAAHAPLCGPPPGEVACRTCILCPTNPPVAGMAGAGGEGGGGGEGGEQSTGECFVDETGRTVMPAES